MTRSHRVLLGVAAVVVLAACGAGKDEAPRAAKRLVYVTNLGEAADARIVIAEVDGTNPRRLTDGYAPVISPDGRHVAFQRCPLCATNRAAKSDLYLIPNAGGSASRLLRDVLRVSWAPDSRSLLATTPQALVSVPIEGATRTLVRGRVFQARHSPDGRNVIYDRQLGTTSDCGPQTDIYSLPAAGGPSRRLTHGGGSAFPVWGSRSIAFARYTADCRIRTVWTMRPDGSGARRVLDPPPAATRPGRYGLVPVEWLQDGRRLVAANVGEFGNEAVVIDTRSGAVRPLGAPVDTVSKDGRWIAGTRSGAEFPSAIVIGSVRGEKARVIAGGRVCCAHWNR